MSKLLCHKFLIDIGCEQPKRYFDYRCEQFRIYYKIEGYDCDILISPSPQVVGEISPATQVDEFSDIEFLKMHHIGDWSIFINTTHNHLASVHTEDELLNLLKACQCPLFTE